MIRARRYIGDPTTQAPTIVQIVALLAIAAVFPARGISAQACPAGLDALSRVQAVFAGHRHTCAITADAHGEQSLLYCWGGNHKDMLGTPDGDKGARQPRLASFLPEKGPSCDSQPSKPYSFPNGPDVPSSSNFFNSSRRMMTCGPEEDQEARKTGGGGGGAFGGAGEPPGGLLMGWPGFCRRTGGQ